MDRYENPTAGFWAQLSILVWGTYSVIASYGHSLAAATVGGVMAGVIVLAEYKRKAVKIMDCTSLGYFLLEVALIGSVGAAFVRGLHLVLAWAIFAAVAWITLAVNFPFAIQYEREKAPRERWHHPLFFAMNRRITAVWAVIFTAGAIMGALSMVWGHRLILGLVLPGLAMAAGVVFSRHYGKRIAVRFENRTKQSTLKPEFERVYS